MSRHGRIALDATLEGTSAALEQLMGHLAGVGTAEDRDAVELASAEVLSNIVRHGYHGRPGPIHIVWVAGSRRIELRFADCGKPIPADSLAQARHTSLDFSDTTVHDLPEGGMGLALVRRLFHRVQYRSRGRVNRLQVARKLR